MFPRVMRSRVTKPFSVLPSAISYIDFSAMERTSLDSFGVSSAARITELPMMMSRRSVDFSLTMRAYRSTFAMSGTMSVSEAT